MNHIQTDCLGCTLSLGERRVGFSWYHGGTADRAAWRVATSSWHLEIFGGRMNQKTVDYLFFAVPDPSQKIVSIATCHRQP